VIPGRICVPIAEKSKLVRYVAPPSFLCVPMNSLPNVLTQLSSFTTLAGWTANKQGTKMVSCTVTYGALKLLSSAR
jgi:hypothetical protein